MMLTNDERARLARMCGGTLRPWIKGLGSHRAEDEALGWEFPNRARIEEDDFHPATDGRHTLMVLEALVVHVGCKQGYSWENVLRDLMWKAHQCYEDEEDFNLGFVVCAAGLELLGKDGVK